MKKLILAVTLLIGLVSSCFAYSFKGAYETDFGTYCYRMSTSLGEYSCYKDKDSVTEILDRAYASCTYSRVVLNNTKLDSEIVEMMKDFKFVGSFIVHSIPEGVAVIANVLNDNGMFSTIIFVTEY